MAKDYLSGKLAVILHADVAGSTALVHQDEQLAHERIQDAFQRFSRNIEKYHGLVHELRGDALLAEFERASDAVAAALAFQADQAYNNSRLTDDLRPTIRVGIDLGEVIIADNTVTGAGVVLAQRVEQLADAGGLCITAALHEAIPRRMPFDLEDLGDQLLKGFDDPVHVYRVELSPGESIPSPAKETNPETSKSPERLKFAIAVFLVVVVAGIAYWLLPSEAMKEPASIERMAFPLPDKPSIAVLPFNNMSDDTQQEYFVDGMTEDLITDLSKLSNLFVVARNSVFTYKGKSVTIKQVAEELGVRYVLEGSVRKADNQVRINAQLIDATTGGHIWADRFDRRYSEIFSLQDELTSHIVAALALKLSPAEEKRLAQHETDSVQAYEAFLQGWAYYEQRPKGFADAVPFFKKAIAIDPDYGRAQAALAATYILGFSNRNLAQEHLHKAMVNPTTVAHRVASLLHTINDEHDEAIAEAERAIALDPNDPVGYFAMNRALTFAGKPAEAVDNIKKAMRLNPHYPPIYLYRLGFAQFGMERYKDTAATLERAILRVPDMENSLELLVSTYGHLGRLSEAKSIRKQLGYWPDCSYGNKFKEQADRERWCEGLRKARL